MIAQCELGASPPWGGAGRVLWKVGRASASWGTEKEPVYMAEDRVDVGHGTSKGSHGA